MCTLKGPLVRVISVILTVAHLGESQSTLHHYNVSFYQNFYGIDMTTEDGCCPDGPPRSERRRQGSAGCCSKSACASSASLAIGIPWWDSGFAPKPGTLYASFHRSLEDLPYGLQNSLILIATSNPTARNPKPLINDP